MKTLSRKNTWIYAILLIFCMHLLTSPLFADEVKNKKVTYASWEEIATAMEVPLNEGYDIYVAGLEGKEDLKEAKKKARDAVNSSYYRFYENLNFEKNVQMYLSGKRKNVVEAFFRNIKKTIKEEGPKETLRDQIDELIVALHQDAADLDHSAREGKSHKTLQQEKEAGQQNTDSSTAVEFEDRSPGVLGFSHDFTIALTLMLREGLEAILIVAAMVAYLHKTNQKKYLKPLYGGAIFGIVASILLAFVFHLIRVWIGEEVGVIGQELFEGFGMFLAVIVLFFVSNWMLAKSEAEAWGHYIQTQVEKSVERRSSIAIAFVSFLAVVREGAELIIFFQASFSAGMTNSTALWAGIVVSIFVLIIIWYLVRYIGLKLPLKPFFYVTSLLMFALSVIFLSKGIAELQEIDWISVTPVPELEFIESDALGIYARMENLIAQGILILIGIGSMTYQVIQSKKLAKGLPVHKRNAPCIKVETYVPASHEKILIAALNEKGYLRDGLYDSCYVSYPVTGHWKALEGANPHTGAVGVLEEQEEIKLEFIILAKDYEAVRTLLFETHPYETPVISFIKLM